MMLEISRALCWILKFCSKPYKFYTLKHLILDLFFVSEKLLLPNIVKGLFRAMLMSTLLYNYEDTENIESMYSYFQS